MNFSMNLIRKIANRIAKTNFARKAIDEGADLSAFKKKLTVQNLLGIFFMGCSYMMGWPAVGLIGALSIHWREPLLLVIGAPVLLVVAHLVFLLGMYLAGGKYVLVFLRWAIRVALEKLM